MKWYYSKARYVSSLYKVEIVDIIHDSQNYYKKYVDEFQNTHKFVICIVSLIMK